MMERLEKLLNYRKDLADEEECLKKALTQIQKQINVLEVEQLHLLNTASLSVSKTHEDVIQVNIKESKPKKLDLEVPSYVQKYSQIEEEEEEEEEEPEKL